MSDTINTPGNVRRRQQLRLAVAFAALGVATLAGVALSGRNGESREPRAVPASPQPSDEVTLAPEQQSRVTVSPVTKGTIPVRAAVPGRVDFDANRVTPLFAQFAGRVVRVDAEVGMVVREGDVLGMLDSSDVVSLQAEYQEARAAMRAALASADHAVRAQGRAARLVAVDAIPRRELQDAEVAAAHATEDLQRAEAALAAARRRLQIGGFSDDDIAQFETDGPAAMTRLVALRAPVAGAIVERNLGIGQVVQLGGDALFKLADLSTVWVMADVYEDQLASIRPGADVRIQTAAYPNETFTARVERVAATVDPEKRTVAVRCSIPNRDGRLKPGMFANVVLQSAAIERALLVPASAIVATGNRRTVFVEREPGTYQEHSVETGQEIAGAVVVTSGVREGDRVAVQGGLLLSRQIAEARGDQ